MKIELITHLEWNRPIPLQVAEVQAPSEGSFIDFPGPQKTFARPHLQPVVGVDGIAGRVLLRKEPSPCFILIDNTQATQIDLPDPPKP